jgi:hypothetical protein
MLFTLSYYGYYSGAIFAIVGLVFNNMLIGMWGCFSFGMCLAVLGMRTIVLDGYATKKELK